jgi:3-oxoacyl-(acyl-carrier-protein) synthase
MPGPTSWPEKSGIDLITKFDASNFACRIAGEVKGFDLESYISAKDARAMDSFIHFGIAAAAQAVQDAGLPTGEALDDELATRIACVIGSGIGGLPLIENTHIELPPGALGASPHFLCPPPSSTWWLGMFPCVLASRGRTCRW